LCAPGARGADHARPTPPRGPTRRRHRRHAVLATATTPGRRGGSAPQGGGSSSGSGSRPPARSQRTPLTPELKKLLEDNFGELPKEEQPKPKQPKQPQQRQQQAAPKATTKPGAGAPGSGGGSGAQAPRRRQPRAKPFADLLKSFQGDGDDKADFSGLSHLQPPAADAAAARQRSPAGAGPSSSSSSSSSGGGASGAPAAGRGAAPAPQRQAPREQQQQQQQQPDAARSSSHASASASGRPPRAGAEPAAAGPPPPVLKGDLELPGGAAWLPLRRQVRARALDPGLPLVDALVIVEGDADYGALARAVSAPCYVCDGTRLFRGFAEREVLALARLGKELVVLTDPDERGLEMRLHLEGLLGPLRHAFVPANEATSSRGSYRHEEGNRGVEHAAPGAIRAALGCAAASFGEGRREFSMQDLVEAQLVSLMEQAGVKNAAFKRQVFCGMLGVGSCNGKKLLRVLNRFATRERFADALARTEAEMEALGVAVGGE
jgi:5S rRNA maturation endonuclease (ribonuclease M5)